MTNNSLSFSADNGEKEIINFNRTVIKKEHVNMRSNFSNIMRGQEDTKLASV